MKTLLIIFLCIVSLSLYSCSSSDPYPNEWGYVTDVQKHGDTVISGNYSITGVRSSTGSTHYFFKIILLPGFHLTDSNNTDNIIIKLHNKDSLSVFIRAITDTIYGITFPANGSDFSVTEEGLEMKPFKKRGDLGFYLPIFSTTNVTLMKGADNSLIVRYYERGLGLFFLIPVYGSVTTFYRFPQYKINW